MNQLNGASLQLLSGIFWFYMNKQLLGHLYTNWVGILWFYMNEHYWCVFTLPEWDFVILHEWTAIGASFYNNWVGFCDFTWMNSYWGIFTITEWDFCNFTWINCNWGIFTLAEWDFVILHEWTAIGASLY